MFSIFVGPSTLLVNSRRNIRYNILRRGYKDRTADMVLALNTANPGLILGITSVPWALSRVVPMYKAEVSPEHYQM